jgi:hypothetical protein
MQRVKPIVATHSGRPGRRVDRVVAAHPATRHRLPRRTTEIIHAVTDPAQPALLITVTERGGG